MINTLLTSCLSTAQVFPSVYSSHTQGKENAIAESGNTILATYQRSSYTTRGAVIGGVSGAAMGGLVSANPVIMATVGTIFGAAIGQDLDYHAQLVTRLAQHHVATIVLGDHVLLILPSRELFVGLTAQMKPEAEETLRLMAAYINCYIKMLVQVAAYTNAVGPPSGLKKLSQQQAETIAYYLSRAGMDARLLYAVGYGGQHLITSHASTVDGNNNYRIEITFNKLTG